MSVQPGQPQVVPTLKRGQGSLRFKISEVDFGVIISRQEVARPGRLRLVSDPAFENRRSALPSLPNAERAVRPVVSDVDSLSGRNIDQHTRPPLTKGIG